MARIRPKIESIAVLWRWQKAQNHGPLKMAYRGVLELPTIGPNLRESLGWQDKMPHYSVPCEIRYPNQH
jgi:hypothetical protein